MKNKFLYTMLLATVLFTFTSCQKKQVDDNTVADTQAIEATQTDPTTDPTEHQDTTEAEATQPIEPVSHADCVLDDVQQVDETSFDCTYESVKHDFVLDMPEVVENAPLVLMLHGYGESAEGFRQKVAFEKDANAKGYAVCYVTGAPSPEDATSANGWNSGIGVSSNDDVGFLCALANYLCETYKLDSTRVYAVGFSNGAFMTHRLALEANDIFAAVVSVAGMMPEGAWAVQPDTCSVGVFQITGEKDDVIPKNSDGSAKFSKAPAIEDVIDYYADKQELTVTETASIGKKSTLTKYASAENTKKVWHLFIPDGRHSWPDEQITGINTNQLILEYLELYRP